MVNPMRAVPVLEINMTYPSDSQPISKVMNKNNNGILKTYNLKTFMIKVKRVRLNPLKKPANIASNADVNALHISFNKRLFRL